MHEHPGFRHPTHMTYTEISTDLPEFDIDESGMRIRKTTIGGIRILTEYIPAQMSVALGCWIGAGSRDEHDGSEGSTHFLEHLLFKGTQNRSAAQIADETDFLGGDFNAMTAKQFTCYHGRVFTTDMARAADLLIDMVTSARLDEHDMLIERDVILDELAMYAQDPSEVGHEALPVALLGQHPLARPVGGTKETVTGLGHDAMTDHYATYYNPNELVLTAAGDVDHEEFCQLVVRLLEAHGWDTGTEPTQRRIETPISYDIHDITVRMPGEQTSVIIGMPGLKTGDHDRYAAGAALTIAGSGTSSRLFQEIREKRGLAYSAYSFSSSYTTGGIVGLAAPTSPHKASAVAALINETFDGLVAGGVTENELESAYRRYRASLAFEAESVHQRMLRLGLGQLVKGSFTSMEENLRRSRSVTRQDVTRVLERLAGGQRALVLAGPGDEI